MSSVKFPAITSGLIRDGLMRKFDFDPYLLRDFYRQYVSDSYLENNVHRQFGSGDSTMMGTGSTNPITDNFLYVAAAAIRENLGMAVSTRTGFSPSFLQGTTHPYARVKPATAAPGNQSRSATVPGYHLTRIDGLATTTWQYDLPQGHTELHCVGVNRTGTTANAAYTVVTGGVDPTGNILFRTNAMADFEPFIRACGTGVGADNSDQLEITAVAAASGAQMWHSGIMIKDINNSSIAQGGFDMNNFACAGTSLYDATNGGIGIFRGDQVDSTPSAAGVYTSNQGYSVASNVGRWINNVDTWGKHRLFWSNYAVNGQGSTTISTCTAAAELERIKLAQLFMDVRGSAANCFHIHVGNLGAGVGRDAQLAVFNGMLANFCEGIGLPFINIMKALQIGGRSKLPAGFDAGDGIHLSTSGYAEVGAIAAECFNQGLNWYRAAKIEGLVK